MKKIYFQKCSDEQIVFSNGWGVGKWAVAVAVSDLYLLTFYMRSVLVKLFS